MTRFLTIFAIILLAAVTPAQAEHLDVPETGISSVIFVSRSLHPDGPSQKQRRIEKSRSGKDGRWRRDANGRWEKRITRNKSYARSLHPYGPNQGRRNFHSGRRGGTMKFHVLGDGGTLYLPGAQVQRQQTVEQNPQRLIPPPASNPPPRPE